MADSSLMLKILTTLDAAGIKATEKQAENLSKKLKNAGLEKYTSGISKGLGKIIDTAAHLPPIFGAATKALGPIGVAITAIYVGIKAIVGVVKGLGAASRAVFQNFSEDGKFSISSVSDGITNLTYNIKHKLKNAWQDFWTGTNDDKEAQKKIEEQDRKARLLVDTYKKGANAIIKANEETAKSQDKLIQQLDRATSKMLKQNQMSSALASAKGDATVLGMEIRKFEEAQAYRDVGDEESAQQLEKAYDVSIAQYKTQRATNEANEKIQNLRDKTNLLMEKHVANQLRILREEENIAKAEQTIIDLKSSGKAGSAKAVLEQRRVIENSKQRLDKYRDAAMKSGDELETYQYESKIMANELAKNIGQAGLQQGIAAMQYNELINQQGARFAISEDWMKSELFDYRQATDVLGNIDENTKALSDIVPALKELLSIKSY